MQMILQLNSNYWVTCSDPKLLVAIGCSRPSNDHLLVVMGYVLMAMDATDVQIIAWLFVVSLGCNKDSNNCFISFKNFLVKYPEQNMGCFLQENLSLCSHWMQNTFNEWLNVTCIQRMAFTLFVFKRAMFGLCSY